MKKWTIGLALIAALPLFGKDKTSYPLDPKASEVHWVGKKMTGQHNGTLQLKEGVFVFEGDKLKGGEFVVDMNSLKVLDLQDPKYNGDLTNHLKSPDFFSAKEYPLAKFKIEKVEAKADGTVEVEGPMTIKGISNNVKVPLKIEKVGAKIAAKGKMHLDRTQWQIKFRSGKFFQNLGDKLIHDDFEVDVSLVGRGKKG